MLDVELTEAEVKAAYDAAVAINDHKAYLKKPGNSHLYVDDPLDARVKSFCAETAVAKVLGIPAPAWPILDGGDRKIDLTLPDGQTVQVKYRGERGRDIATEGLDFWDELRADYYVLVWPGREPGRIFTVVGWATREDFFRRVTDRPPVRMRGRKWEIRWQDLRDIEGGLCAAT